MIPNSETVHGAVQVNPWDAVAVGGKNILQYQNVVHLSCAFIVYNDVVATGVIWIPVKGERRVSGSVVGVNLIDDNVSSSLDAFLEDIFLLVDRAYGMCVSYPAQKD